VHARLLAGVEPFPTPSVVPYDPGYVAGWTVERYQVDLRAAATEAKQQMHATLRSLCGSQVPGDTHRNLEVRASFEGERFKHVLVPVWLVSYDFSGRPYQVVVNGVTGKVAGERPWSWIKIALLVIVVLVLLYLFNS
jgi:hypothetical protein